MYRARALYEYKSDHNEDLNFAAGQEIEIIGEEDEEWLKGEYVDQRGEVKHGIFPKNFVERLAGKRCVVNFMNPTDEMQIRSKLHLYLKQDRLKRERSVTGSLPSTNQRSPLLLNLLLSLNLLSRLSQPKVNRLPLAVLYLSLLHQHSSNRHRRLQPLSSPLYSRQNHRCLIMKITWMKVQN